MDMNIVWVANFGTPSLFFVFFFVVVFPSLFP